MAWAAAAVAAAVGVALFTLPSRSGVADDSAQMPSPTEPIVLRQTTRVLATPRNDMPGLSNFAQVSPILYRSAQPTAEGFRQLRLMGVRGIINLRAVHNDRDELAGLGMRYTWIHFQPWHPEEQDVVRFLKAVSDPSNQPALVHCQHGADRTGTMVALYRVVIEGWELDDAMQELPRFGFHAIWKDLQDFLRASNPGQLRDKVAKAPAPVFDVVP